MLRGRKNMSKIVFRFTPLCLSPSAPHHFPLDPVNTIEESAAALVEARHSYKQHHGARDRHEHPTFSTCCLLPCILPPKVS